MHESATETILGHTHVLVLIERLERLHGSMRGLDGFMSGLIEAGREFYPKKNIDRAYFVEYDYDFGDYRG